MIDTSASTIPEPIVPAPPAAEVVAVPLPNFHLIIRNRAEVLFDGQVNALTSVNAKGKFDVLPDHANFISLIERYVILHRKGQPDQTIKIPGGIIHVEKAESRVYLD